MRYQDKELERHYKAIHRMMKQSSRTDNYLSQRGTSVTETAPVLLTRFSYSRDDLDARMAANWVGRRIVKQKQATLQTNADALTKVSAQDAINIRKLTQLVGECYPIKKAFFHKSFPGEWLAANNINVLFQSVKSVDELPRLRAWTPSDVIVVYVTDPSLKIRLEHHELQCFVKEHKLAKRKNAELLQTLDAAISERLKSKKTEVNIDGYLSKMAKAFVWTNKVVMYAVFCLLIMGSVFLTYHDWITQNLLGFLESNQSWLNGSGDKLASWLKALAEYMAQRPNLSVGGILRYIGDQDMVNWNSRASAAYNYVKDSAASQFSRLANAFASYFDKVATVV